MSSEGNSIEIKRPTGSEAQEPVLRVVKDELPDGKDRVEDYLKTSKNTEPDNGRKNFDTLTKIWKEDPTKLNLREAHMAELKRDLGYAEDEDPRDPKFARTEEKEKRRILKEKKLEEERRIRDNMDRISRDISAREDKERREKLEKEIHDLSPEPLKPVKNTSFGSSAFLAGNRRIVYRETNKYPFNRPERSNPKKPEVLSVKPMEGVPIEKPVEVVKPIVEQPSQSLQEALDSRRETRTAPKDVETTFGKKPDQVLERRKEAIVDRIMLGEDLSEEDREVYKDHLLEIQTLVNKRYGEGNAVFDVKKPEAPKTAEKFSPEKELAKPAQTKTEIAKKVDVSQEARNGDIDGLVDFNLSRLGINKTDLVREMPNFFTLSVSQQSYILEKLRQKVGHDLDRDTDAELKNTRGIKRLFKGFRAGSVRSRLAQETKSRGLASYRENLEDITTFVKNRDLEVEMTENGMILKFLSREPDNEIHRQMMEEYNRRATALAEIPYDRTLDDRTPLQILQKRKYEKARKAFDEASGRLLRFENGKYPDQVNQKALEFSNIEDDIRMNQALTYNQEATSWVGKKIKEFGLAEKGVIAGAGFAARGLAKYAAGFGGGVVAGYFLGGAMGRLRKGKEFQNIAYEKRYADISQAKEGETRPVMEKRAGVKEFIDSKGYADRIQKLLLQIEKASGNKRENLIQSLHNRVLVARERDEAGLVRFGNAKEEMKNKFGFFQSMKEAQRILLESDEGFLAKANEVAEKLNNQYYKDGDKDEARREEMKKAFLRGARNGAIFFTLGFEANDWLFHHGEATKAGIEKMAQWGSQMNGVFTEIGESVREKMSVVSDQNIIGAGKKLVADAQNEYNKFNFYNNRGDASVESIRRINPISENPINVAAADSTYVKTPANLGDVNLETPSHPVNFPGNMPRPAGLPNGSFENISPLPKPEDLSHNVSEIITPAPTPIAEASVSARGAIGTIRDLQRALINQYGGNMPENLKSFVSGNPDRIAVNWGVFRPEDVNESVSLPSGSSLVALPDGNISLKLPDGKLVSMTDGTGDIKLDFFDSSAGKHAAEVVASPEMTTSAPDVSEVAPTPQTIPENIGEMNQVTVDPENPKFDFEEWKRMSEAEGWTHTPSETGHGDVLTYKIHPETPSVESVDYDQSENLASGTSESEIATQEDFEKEKALEEAHELSEVPKEGIVKGVSISPDSKIYLDAVSKYGKARVEGNVVFFNKGSVGFYAESKDLSVAMQKAESTSRLNYSIIGRMQERIATRMPDGKYRVLYIYKKL